jgi:hypothetical protein
MAGVDRGVREIASLFTLGNDSKHGIVEIYLGYYIEDLISQIAGYNNIELFMGECL